MRLGHDGDGVESHGPEHDHQRRDGDAHLDDVGGRQRQAHTEDDGGDHDVNQGQHQMPARKVHDDAGEFDGDAGEIEGPHHDARGDDGHGHGGGLDAALNKRVPDGAGTHARLLAEPAHNHDADDTAHHRVARAEAGHQEIDEDNQGQRQVAPGHDGLLEARQLLPRHRGDVLLDRVDVHHDAHGEEVQHRGDQDVLHHVHVRDAGVLRHQEAGRGHHGRHDQSAGGRGRFHRPGHVALETDLLHHRDAEGPGDDGVGRAAAGDGAHEAAGHDRNLGRAAPEPSGQGSGELNGEQAEARLLEEGAEDDEQEDEVGRDVGRQPEQPVGEEVQIVGHLRRRVTQVVHESGQVRPREREQENDQGQRRQRPADGATAGLQRQRNRTKSQDDLKGGELLRVADVLDDPVVLVEKIAHGHEPQANDDDIVPGNFPVIRPAERRIAHEGDEHHQRDVDHAMQVRFGLAEEAGVDVVGRGPESHQAQDDPGDACQVTLHRTALCHVSDAARTPGRSLTSGWLKMSKRKKRAGVPGPALFA